MDVPRLRLTRHSRADESMTFHIAVDTGGTFTDVVVADSTGELWFNKALTTPTRASEAVLEALGYIANDAGVSADKLLESTDLFTYGTTRATNAILTGSTARTGFFVTEGFPDVLTLREGGKSDPFDFSVRSPTPYVPRHLTFEIPGRIDAQGRELQPFDRTRAAEAIASAADHGCEAVAVCFLWSFINPAHELAFAELLKELAPGLPFTLSHQLNPRIREYRRASSTAIDASLKPLMQDHFGTFALDLEKNGFRGDLFVVTSAGGCLHVDDITEQPIYSVYSGPSMAPVSAMAYADQEGSEQDTIVFDTGGTSFDVSLIQDRRLGRTREKWLGVPFESHLTGIASVAVSSIGAGGGSIAWIDDGGLLRVGPQSAGAEPGPVCYGRGGTQPTVTDAAVVLGYLDPAYFLGGRLPLQVEHARSAITKAIGEPLGLDVFRASEAIHTVASEAMVSAVEEITINQGVDPRDCLLVAGGGAGGLNAVMIARELGCRRVLVPRTAGALSAAGALLADIVAEFNVSRALTTATFDFAAAHDVIASLNEQMTRFLERLKLDNREIKSIQRDVFVEARYPYQVWEIEVEVPDARLETDDDVRRLLQRFHEVHERTFAVNQPDQQIECQHWRGRLTVELSKPSSPAVSEGLAPEESERL